MISHAQSQISVSGMLLWEDDDKDFLKYNFTLNIKEGNEILHHKT